MVVAAIRETSGFCSYDSLFVLREFNVVLTVSSVPSLPVQAGKSGAGTWIHYHAGRGHNRYSRRIDGRNRPAAWRPVRLNIGISSESLLVDLGASPVAPAHQNAKFWVRPVVVTVTC